MKDNNVVSCPPCGENVALATKRGLLNKEVFMDNPSPALRTTSPAGGEVNGGFTLIELLVVVLIIGILAAVALPQYQKAVLKSRLATVMHLVKTIHEAQEVYYLANGKYTNQIEDLDIELPEATRTSSPGGNTWLTWNNGQYRVAIETSLVSGAVRNKEGDYDLQYQQYYSHSVGKNEILCAAFDNVAKSVCQGFGCNQINEPCRAGDTGQTCTYYTCNNN